MIDRRTSDAERLRKGGLAPYDEACDLDGVATHAASIRPLDFVKQELLAFTTFTAAHDGGMKKQDIGPWVRQARKAKGWTQTQLGEAVGVTKGNVSHWELGLHEPSFLQMLRIRDVTGFPLHDVLDPKDWPFQNVDRRALAYLTPSQLAMIEAGIRAVIAAMTGGGG